MAYLSFNRVWYKVLLIATLASVSYHLRKFSYQPHPTDPYRPQGMASSSINHEDGRCVLIRRVRRDLIFLGAMGWEWETNRFLKVWGREGVRVQGEIMIVNTSPRICVHFYCAFGYYHLKSQVCETSVQDTYLSMLSWQQVSIPK